VNAEGAGAASRRALGTAVFGGMLTSTFLAVLFVPVFYTVLQRLSEHLGRSKKKSKSPADLQPDGKEIPEINPSLH
jgi:HAE1 family hydrophobic/amphiphilic exporter-1